MNTYNKNTQKLTVSHKSYYNIRNSRYSKCIHKAKLWGLLVNINFFFPAVSSRECVYFYSALRSWIIKLLTFTSWWGPRPCFVGLTTSFTGTSQTVPKITFKGATDVKLKGRIRWRTYSGRGISVLYKFNWVSYCCISSEKWPITTYITFGHRSWNVSGIKVAHQNVQQFNRFDSFWRALLLCPMPQKKYALNFHDY